MTNVIELKDYKRSKRKVWFLKNRVRLEQYLEDSMFNLSQSFDFSEIAASYQDLQYTQSKLAWDYQDLRELMIEGFDNEMADQLYLNLRKEHWFDATLCSKEEVIERCLSCFVMNSLKQVP